MATSNTPRELTDDEFFSLVAGWAQHGLPNEEIARRASNNGVPTEAHEVPKLLEETKSHGKSVTPRPRPTPPSPAPAAVDDLSTAQAKAPVITWATTDEMVQHVACALATGLTGREAQAAFGLSVQDLRDLRDLAEDQGLDTRNPVTRQIDIEREAIISAPPVGTTVEGEAEEAQPEVNRQSSSSSEPSDEVEKSAQPQLSRYAIGIKRRQHLVELLPQGWPLEGLASRMNLSTTQARNTFNDMVRRKTIAPGEGWHPQLVALYNKVYARYHDRMKVTSKPQDQSKERSLSIAGAHDLAKLREQLPQMEQQVANLTARLAMNEKEAEAFEKQAEEAAQVAAERICRLEKDLAVAQAQYQATVDTLQLLLGGVAPSLQKT